MASVLRKILPERQRNGTKKGGGNDCIIRPLLENSARSSCSEYAIPALSSTFMERGLTFHLRTPRVGLPFLPFSFSSSLFLSLSLTAWHYSLLPRAWCEQGKTVSPINLREQTGETSQIKSGWIYERTRATISFCLSFLVVLVTGGVLRLLPFLWSSSPPAIRFPSGQQPAEEHGGLRGVRRGGRSSKYFWGRKEATSVTLPRVCSGGDENNAR